MRVRVAKNLHKNQFSIRTLQDGRWKVDDYAKAIILYDCHFIINEKGRQRVLREKRKNLHAFIDGRAAITEKEFIDHYLTWANVKPITYNPYKKGFFYWKCNGRPVKEGCTIVCTLNGLYAW